MWQPKNGTTTLDNIDSAWLPGFAYALLRNGHVVAMFVTLDVALAKCTERARALPDDIWSVFAR